jgi:hypothetical protein
VQEILEAADSSRLTAEQRGNRLPFLRRVDQQMRDVRWRDKVIVVRKTLPDWIVASV